MFKIVLLGLLLTNAADTVWWNSFGGSVKEHRDRNTVTCTLTLQDPQSQVAFTWSNRLPLRVVVESKALSFRPGEILQIAMRIGNVWLARGDGKPNIPAITAPSAVMLILNEPLENMLLSARDIEIHAPDHPLTIDLVPSQTRNLVEALRDCNAVIARLG